MKIPEWIQTRIVSFLIIYERPCKRYFLFKHKKPAAGAGSEN